MGLTNKDKIKMYYQWGVLVKDYIPFIDKHSKGLISDMEFLCECNMIKNRKNMESFKSLKEVDEEINQIFGK